MPTIKLTVLSFIILSCFTFSKCKKDEPLSEFYFQCKVDGILYEPDNCANCKTTEIFGDSLLLMGMNISGASLGVAVRKQGLSTGSYEFTKLLLENKATGSYDNTIGNPSDIFRTDSLRIGLLKITELNRTKKTIVGTFNFDAYNIPQNKTVRVTEGKFRLNYRTY